jgi:carbon monoxide dehydrogenase subunit G
MDITGEQRIAIPRQAVWDGLNNPEMLRASIPGCETLERVGDDQFTATVAMRIGPMSLRFGGKVQLENLEPPMRYSIRGEGNGGPMGFAKGVADVALAEDGPDATILTYTARTQIGGKMAQLGTRLIESTARKVSDQFFTAFAAQLEVAHAPQAAAPAAGTPTPAAAESTAGPEARTREGSGLSKQSLLYAAGALVLAIAAYYYLR